MPHINFLNSKRNKGTRHSEETIEKIRKNRKDQTGKHWKQKAETVLKKSLSISGKNHWNWQGGLNLQGYSVDWSRTLRRSIRERDNYTCRICGRQDDAMDVHHIDYDKDNCDPNNLITLCRACHSKTNFNRGYWKDWFCTRK